MEVYLDNAATTMVKPDCVIEAVAGAMKSFGNSGRGAHEASLDASRTIFEARERISKLFHGYGPSQTAFSLNATESLNTVLLGLFQPGDHVITTVMEHNSVLRPLYRLEREGVSLTFLPCDALGRLRYDKLSESLRPSTRAVVCTHASNVTGNVVDLMRIGQFCREHGLYFVVDASQTAGVLPIDMRQMGIDALCFTGHKGLMGPQGTGGLCLRTGLMVRPLKSGGSGIESYNKEHPIKMPTALEAGTLNSHGIAGLLAALIYLEDRGIEEIHRREIQLMRRFYDGVREIPDLIFYGDYSGDDRAAIVSLNLGKWDSSRVSDELFTTYQISTRAGAHCAPLIHEALGTKEQGMVRFSFSCFNTEAEIDYAVGALRELAKP